MYFKNKIININLCNCRTLTEYFDGLFPRDNPKNTRFAINYFTSIGLGGLTYVLKLLKFVIRLSFFIVMNFENF